MNPQQRGDLSRRWWILTAVMLGTPLWGCAKTVVQPKYEQHGAGPVVRPNQIFVYDFAITAAEVRETQGVLAGIRHALSNSTEHERELAIAQDVQNRMSEDLVAGIQELGLPVQRAPRDNPLPPDSLVVTGLFLNVDEGNRVQRAVLGLGAGQSAVDTQVQVYAPSAGGLTRLLEFRTHADSGSSPGALVMGGAGAAAQGGMTAGMVGANMGVSGIKGHQSQVAQMTARSAEQVVAYLSEYFAKQGWIASEKVKRAKVANE